MYYTELPTKSRSRPKTSKQKKALETKRAKKFHRRQAIQMSMSEAEHLLDEIAPDWFKDTTTELAKEPVVVMEFQGHTPEQRIRVEVPRSPRPEEIHSSWINSYSDIAPHKDSPSKPRKLSPHLSKTPLKPIRDKKIHYKKVGKEEPYEIPPNSTVIKMQLSGTTGKPFAYDQGLPEEQDSYLAVTTSKTVRPLFQ